MIKVEFQIVYKGFRYEIAETDSDEFYIVDMGIPIVTWFLWMYSYFRPRKCYSISHETAKTVLSQEKVNAIPGVLAGGLGIFLTSLVRYTNNSWSVAWEKNTKIVIISVVAGLVMLIRLCYMIEAKRNALKAGAVLKAEKLKMLRFKPLDASIVAILFLLMLGVVGTLILFAVIILEPIFNVIFIFLFGVMFHVYIALSSRVLSPGRTFILYKYKNSKHGETMNRTMMKVELVNILTAPHCKASRHSYFLTMSIVNIIRLLKVTLG
ncbi:hypothetical protein AUQ39_04875 [Lacticaseibacillus casei]|nr:hypothetical protein AUQ39_04875 [Lacticaseibacillus casei]